MEQKRLEEGGRAEVQIRKAGPEDVRELEELVRESEEEGFRHLRRLADDYASGENRFDREGEVLLLVYADGSPAGVCGLNRIPGDAAAGRVRRMYVRRDLRRCGIGRALLQAVMERARPHFARLELRTDSPAAGDFYTAAGFRQAAGREDVTHLYEWMEEEQS
ncbi:GCN5-like N-acetyltransferase [Paenibacillus mucilaginosus 3016]|uniref:GCN5-like N-acetyltransferase n=1 Tax=Paenibacillus mucilaginosus 3016 TaxID=1116391 RepID=H6NN85_9BACL|nr:GNAT family N-acetyltransferase [Paenibacillus mucilaginosus]AFC31761.1 GCN5-like N-acetyltransferase [Paenibacillus mucilaginosus 3016]WFA20280.1 N-acetyltransferase [Paenibacillus mucilaginosus]